ncbi:MAG: Hsp20/alpha crystallin family protein [Proteobacteria bacterium]|nr:Hsp20/alpha crystallin family protein [Pseudomonadota bacterium]
MILKRIYSEPKWSDPFNEFSRLMRLLNTFEAPNRNAYDDAGAGVFPLLNVSSTADHYIVRAELPGIKAGELDIKVTGNNLTLAGERKIPEENNQARYHRREREAGKFSRALTLPGPLNADKVDARLKNGILTIVIPKADEAKPRKISIH